jgi:hypothetical protein
MDSEPENIMECRIMWRRDAICMAQVAGRLFDGLRLKQFESVRKRERGIS